MTTATYGRTRLDQNTIGRTDSEKNDIGIDNDGVEGSIHRT